MCAADGNNGPTLLGKSEIRTAKSEMKFENPKRPTFKAQLRLRPTRWRKSAFPGEAPRSAAACRRLSDSGCADLRRGGRAQGGSKLQHSQSACSARWNLTQMHRIWLLEVPSESGRFGRFARRSWLLQSVVRFPGGDANCGGLPNACDYASRPDPKQEVTLRTSAPPRLCACVSSFGSCPL